MSVDETIYMNTEELEINKTKQPNGIDGAADVAHSKNRRFKIAIVFLGLLSSTFLITTIAVGARYNAVYAQMWGRLWNFTLEMEALQIQVQNLTEEKEQINTSYHLNVKELETTKKKMRSCPEGWILFDCSCYFVSKTTTTWADSRGQCQTKGADLVIVKNQREMEFLNTLGASFWIGLQRSSDQVWKWNDGSSLTNSFWQSGHPQNYNQNIFWKSNCAAFNRYHSLTRSWSSLQCSSRIQWVCEKKAHLPSVK